VAVVVADTNVIVRFLVKEPQDQYLRARGFMEKVSAGRVELRISAAVVGEVAAVLHHVYDQPQREVAEKLLALVTSKGVDLEEAAHVVAALKHSRDLNDVDFVDAYVAAKAIAEALPIASFDKGLHKRLGTIVFDL
jgi:predicted nucleic-acid-binding protein